MRLRTQIATSLLAATLAACFGCESSKQHRAAHVAPGVEGSFSAVDEEEPIDQPEIRLVDHETAADELPPLPVSPDGAEEPAGPATPVPWRESLADLEATALSNNPTLRRLQQDAAAKRARVGYISKLPDPSVSSKFFTPPMMLDPDRQVAEVEVMQMIPWIDRLCAEKKQAHLEALAAENEYHAERLRVIGELRVTWYRLYVLGKQIETTEADSGQLESLIKTANARVATGNAEPGDVLMATLELSSLQEQLLSYRQQMASATAELNRLLGRDANSPIALPDQIDRESPNWSHDELRSVAMSSQPELNAARLRTAAASWGVEVARLRQRPDVTFSAGWISMDAIDATMPGAGADTYTVGFSTNLPFCHSKYDAMRSEAARQQSAASASEDEIEVKLDATLRDLAEQARAAQQTVELYERTILPQARQTYEADQKSLVNNTVTFDRVIRDYRTLLNLELGYHRALGQHATALARIRQTVGVDLSTDSYMPPAPASE